jgi:hypothetical protein
MDASPDKDYVLVLLFIKCISDKYAGVVKNVQESEVETLIGLLKEGRSVRTGIAVFRPIIDAHGNLSVNKRITAAPNVPSARLESAGKVNNSVNIGKTTE